MKRLTLAGFAGAAVLGLCGFFLQSSPPPVQTSGLPPEVGAAGMTSLILNADFSLPQYANVNNWVVDCGATNSIPSWHLQWFQNGDSVCNSGGNGIDVENDPTISKNVLHMFFNHFNNAIGSNPGHQTLALSYPVKEFSQPNTTNLLPLQFYAEYVEKFTPASLTQGQILSMHAHYVTGNNYAPNWSELGSNTNTGSGWTYMGGAQEYDPNSGAVVNDWNPCDASPRPSGCTSDFTAYHKYGMLFTGKGNAVSVCAYLDGVKINCAGGTLANPTQVLPYHNGVYQVSLGTDFNNDCSAGKGCGVVTNDMHNYIQSVKIWACPGSNLTATDCRGVICDNTGCH